MNDQGTGTAGDLDVLLLTTAALVDVARLDATLREHGDTYDHGGLVRRPEAALKDQAWKRALAGLRALGLAPASRGQVEPLTLPGPIDPLEALLRKRDRQREVGP